MPEDLIRDVLAGNAGRPCLTCSFQVEDMIVLDMLRKLRPNIPVLFLETGYHFRETYEYRDRMAREWQLNLINVKPLLRALADYEIWFTGLRREQSPTRAGLQPVETHRLPSGKELLKVSPLALWTWKDVWSYVRVNEIEVLPLYDQGYPSIGCEPCTTLPSDVANLRSGRWGGVKLECGIHVFDATKETA